IMSGLMIGVLFATGDAAGQSVRSVRPAKPMDAAVNSVTASPAYAEVLLRRTDMTAELESLLSQYTEEHPKVLELKTSLAGLTRETIRLSKVGINESGRLTVALGRLIVRKIEIETDVWKLLRVYKEEHPEVKRAKRKVEIYEAAIKEILG
ncbi:MAG: hypothetical protein LC730_01070, partial [Acidobacteria bacterium]|nr:hypothetical protein [Acidobacteriota bacterium]MCA1608039.1 hypothetical protein [Acidobacteriota bacterium]